MVYLKGVLVILPLLLMLLAVCMPPAASTRIAYKKPIYGKTNHLKEKRYRARTPTPIARTATANATATVPVATTISALAAQQNVESTTKEAIANATTRITTTTTSEQQPLHVTLENVAVTTTEMPTTNLRTTTTAGRQVPMPDNLPVPCTCGVFMASQIKRMSRDPPTGEPVVMHELERYFPCNAIGQKQCQTKCLETLVQYLPNSANILCASLDRDCRKERAYLFLKNCRNQWVNTNLTAGREYCCSNGKPYPCPLI